MTILENLIKQRDDLLKEKPWLQATQDKIDQTLAAVGADPTKRCLALVMLIQQMTGLLTKKIGELLPYEHLNTRDTDQR